MSKVGPNPIPHRIYLYREMVDTQVEEAQAGGGGHLRYYNGNDSSSFIQEARNDGSGGAADDVCYRR
jgi:hypothetical protein